MFGAVAGAFLGCLLFVHQPVILIIVGFDILREKPICHPEGEANVLS